MLKWLNDNPGIGILTAILIAAVSGVAALARRMSKRRSDSEPILIFTEEIEPGEPNYNRALYIKNTGRGAALNIVRRIENDPLELVKMRSYHSAL